MDTLQTVGCSGSGARSVQPRPSRSRLKLIGGIVADIQAGRPVVAIDGAPGVGKTLLVGDLATNLTSDHCVVIIGGADDPLKLQRGIADAFGIADGAKIPPQQLLEDVTARVTEPAAKIVVLFDDAENLSVRMLRYIWLLSVLFDFSPIKIHLVLIGALGPWPGLDHPDLDSLNQAVSKRLTIWPLRELEAEDYFDSRLSSFGAPPHQVASRTARAEMLEQTAGIPAGIDQMTKQVLAQSQQIGSRPVAPAATRTLAQGQPTRRVSPAPATRGGAMRRLGPGVVFAILLVIGGGIVMSWRDASPVPVSTGAAPKAADLPALLASMVQPFRHVAPTDGAPPDVASDKVVPGSVAPESMAPEGVAAAPSPAVLPVEQPAPPLADTPSLPERVALNYPGNDPNAAILAGKLAADLRTKGVLVVGPAPAAQRSARVPIAYFFSRDLRAATALQQSMAEVTGRDPAVAFVHRNPLPAPGTVELMVTSP